MGMLNDCKDIVNTNNSSRNKSNKSNGYYRNNNRFSEISKSNRIDNNSFK